MFLSNWELSTARADAVLQFFIHHGVDESRLTVAGYADQNPIAPNDDRRRPGAQPPRRRGRRP